MTHSLKAKSKIQNSLSCEESGRGSSKGKSKDSSQCNTVKVGVLSLKKQLEF